MAVPTSAFSIREYALNKRSTDLTRISWPFSEKVKKEVAVALLPPMDVRKFRWWSSSLEEIRVSEEEEEEEKEVIIERIKMQKICPVCGVFVAATVNAVNAHIDTCLAQTRSKDIMRNNKGGDNLNLNLKAKSRTPKKRSIAEIFAVAPPVKTMIIVNDCCDGEEKAVGKQIIRHNNNNNLKRTSLATSLVSTIKTINTKITTTEQPSILLKKKKKKRKKRNKVCAIFSKFLFI